jgi:hypothetical protein
MRGESSGGRLAEAQAASAHAPGSLLSRVRRNIRAYDSCDGVGHELVELGERVSLATGADSAQEVHDAADVGGSAGEDKDEGRVVEGCDGGVESAGLGHLVHELLGLLSDAHPQPLDRCVVRGLSAGHGGVGRDGRAGPPAAHQRLRGASPGPDRRAEQVPRGEPEVAVERIAAHVRIIYVPDVRDARGAVGDAGSSGRREVPCGVRCRRRDVCGEKVEADPEVRREL